jgi:hypothetical protein
MKLSKIESARSGLKISSEPSLGLLLLSVLSATLPSFSLYFTRNLEGGAMERTWVNFLHEKVGILEV